MGVGALAALAGAQAPVDRPLDSTSELPGEFADTELTPRVRSADGSWQQVAGAVFPTEQLVADSPAAFDEDFYAVSMRNTKLGFAGGAKCRVETAPEEIASCDLVSGNPAVGERVPVIYRFRQLNTGDRVWEPMELEGSDRPGYVGAIAWLDAETAVAVGGTGTYPRREPGCETESPACVDPAGAGRAWRYEAGEWRELDLSSQRAQGMGGLTAIAFNPQTDSSYGAVLVAGGLGQIWAWEKGSFVRRVDRHSPREVLRNRHLFRFRVRQIKPRLWGGDNSGFVAVTSGCCGATPAHNVPRVLNYARPSTRSPASWSVDAENLDPADPEAMRDAVNDPAAECRRRFGSFNGCTPLDPLSPVGPDLGGEHDETADSGRSAGPRVDSRLLGESFYAVMAPAIQPRITLLTSVLVSAGGSELDGERPSQIVQRTQQPLDGLRPRHTVTSLATSRLVDADGDAAGSQSISSPHAAPSGPDGIPDWAVGETRSRASRFGRRGLFVATHQRASLRPDTLSEPTDATTDPTGYDPTDEGRVERYLSPGLVESPSYSLNAIDMVESGGVETGQGWAVGDRGAIVGLNETGGGKPVAEPPATRLGARTEGRLPDAAAYESLGRPPTTAAGLVPTLSEQPDDVDGDWRLRPTARLEVARRIVMSRSGDEGWALGGTEGEYGVSHFDGRQWNVCGADDAGVPGLPAPDPACEGVGELFKDASVFSGVPVAAARVPFEADEDPANDDEFEVVAATTGQHGGILRYRDGRWRRERTLPAGQETPSAVAFSHPDDGWVLWGRPDSLNFAGSTYRFFHYDGTGWTSCYRESDDRIGSDDCDPNLRLPQRAGHGAVNDLVGTAGRVYAIGERRQTVPVPNRSVENTASVTRVRQPLIVYREPGKPWAADLQPGEYDPGLTQEDKLERINDSGEVDSLAIARRPDGVYEGWATGVFGLSLLSNQVVGGGGVGGLGYRTARPPATPLLRLEPGASSWRRGTIAEAGPYREYARWFDTRSTVGDRPADGTTRSNQIAIEPGGGESSPAFLTQDTGRLFRWHTKRRRWELLRVARPAASFFSSRPNGYGAALAGDARGGFFAFAWPHMLHYADRQPRAVFTEVPRPEFARGRQIKALSAGPDGTLWAATNSDVVYRYRREIGWDKTRVPGWDPGRVVTTPSQAHDIAVGASGEGLVVGEAGRIAGLTDRGVRMDAAAGRGCAGLPPTAPCGTTRDLLSVAVAPDGSAIAGGKRLSLIWRAAGGDFRPLARPDATAGEDITAVAMPTPERAWLATKGGLVFAGELRDGEWAWSLENVDAHGDLIGVGALSAIEVDRNGHGYALGATRMLERTSDGTWRVVDLEASSIATLSGDGPGAIVGEPEGGIRTLVDGRFEIARARDIWHAGAGRVSAVALAPGVEEGQVEAWAILETRPLQRLLHHTSDPGEPLLNPTGRAQPLPDAPAPRPGELSFAVFGKSDCHTLEGARCHEMAGLSEHSEELTSRIVAEITRRSRLPNAPTLAISTGDATDMAGYVGEQAAESSVHGGAAWPHGAATLAGGQVSGYGPAKLRRWGEFVVDRLEDEGVPLFGAIGGGDLSSGVCSGGGCDTLRRSARAGDNLAWRQAMARRPAPWGEREQAAAGGISFEPVEPRGISRRTENVEVAEPGDDEVPRSAATVPAGGASTHFALDVVSEAEGRPVARLVFLDSSFGSLWQSDPVQQPLAGDGGQLAWLERVVCTRESVAATSCTRRADQPAIVVSNTPTYSYFPGLGLQAAADGAAIESVLLRHRVSVMLSGRLGWNGLYWATAPGLHYPCSGQRYSPDPPDRPGSCAGSGPGESDAAGTLFAGADELAGALQATGAPPPPDRGAVRGTPLDQLSGRGLLPVAVASGAGGKVGVPGGAAGDGFWHGFSIVRVAADGDPRKTIVEQRPIYDWVSIEAQERTLRPGQKMTLRGFARGPIANRQDDRQAPSPVQLDRIDSAAVTHRYDLLLADPDKPWLPQTDADGDYVQLDPAVATVDSQTGVIKVGRGRQGRTYAIGMLSVGEKAATYPLVFEPAKSFTPRPAVSATIRPPVVQPPAIKAPPPIQVLSQPPAQPPATPPPPAQLPTIGELSLPAPPQLPTVGATPTAAPTPAPPPPPTPPPPPGSAAGLPLNLNAPISPISIVPTVIPPTPPPINPAPPGGSAARKEARQRQAATAKSEEGQATPTEADVGTGDSPPGAHGAAMTRRDRIKPAASFTATARPEQASAWTRGALYGGGLGVMAFVMAAGWLTARPKPRRRPPHQPAPAWAPSRRRR